MRFSAVPRAILAGERSVTAPYGDPVGAGTTTSVLRSELMEYTPTSASAKSSQSRSQLDSLEQARLGAETLERAELQALL